MFNDYIVIKINNTHAYISLDLIFWPKDVRTQDKQKWDTCTFAKWGSRGNPGKRSPGGVIKWDILWALFTQAGQLVFRVKPILMIHSRANNVSFPGNSPFPENSHLFLNSKKIEQKINYDFKSVEISLTSKRKRFSTSKRNRFHNRF